MQGVLPLLSFILRSAPLATKTGIASGLHCIAWSKGVQPSLSLILGSAPLAIKAGITAGLNCAA